MITAWILFLDTVEGLYFFEERDGTDFSSTDPTDWGLDETRHSVVLTFHQASFLGAWIEGNRIKGH